MNIVVLSHRVPYPPNKGEKIRTYYQLESLQKVGCEMAVFCPLHEPEDSRLVDEYVATRPVRVYSEHAGNPWWRMLRALGAAGSLSVAKFFLPKLQAQLDSYLASNKVELLYCTSSAMAQYAFKAVKDYPSLRVIVDFMDLDSDKWNRFSEVSVFPLSLIYRYEAGVLRRYECRIQSSVEKCLFVSQAEVDLYHKKNERNADNLAVIGNGVDLSDFYPPPERAYNAPLNLLFTGVMDYLPNEDAVCWFVDNVWHTITVQHPEVRLVIAGMKPTQRVKALETVGNITVTGFVEEMLPYYHDADIFVAPFQIARGVQNKVLQAFACGLPVVTTPLGAEGIDGIDGKHFLVAKSPSHFCSQIERLVRDPELFQKISLNAWQLVTEDYLWEAKNQALIELIFREDGL